MDPQSNGVGSGALADDEVVRQLEAAAREREDRIGELQAEIDSLNGVGTWFDVLEVSFEAG